MATAPVPGSVRKEAERQGVMAITITVHRPIHVTRKGQRVQLPETVTVAPDLVPIRERTIIRKATGLPISAYWAGQDAIDLDSIVVMWWVGRRLAGESTLTWAQAADQWPLDLDIDEELTVDAYDPDDIDDEELDELAAGEVDHPES